MTPERRPKPSSARAMVGVAAIAEVEPEHVDAGHEKAVDDVGVRTRGAKRGDDLGVAGSAHGHFREGASMKIARKSLTLVSVGPVITESPSASKKP